MLFARKKKQVALNKATDQVQKRVELARQTCGMEMRVAETITEMVMMRYWLLQPKANKAELGYLQPGKVVAIKVAALWSCVKFLQKSVEYLEQSYKWTFKIMAIGRATFHEKEEQQYNRYSYPRGKVPARVNSLHRG